MSTCCWVVLSPRCSAIKDVNGAPVKRTLGRDSEEPATEIRAQSRGQATTLLARFSPTVSFVSANVRLPFKTARKVPHVVAQKM
jgi:hypothetical protein